MSTLWPYERIGCGEESYAAPNYHGATNGRFDPRPPRGERQTKLQIDVAVVVSIHAPEESDAAGRVTDFIRGFDPRPPGESDSHPAPRSLSPRQVSIHAPRGERPISMRRADSSEGSFDPRPPGESDLTRKLTPRPRRRFRSTPPRGERLDEKIDTAASKEVSIHAPPGRATPATQRPPYAIPVSIHAPPGRATIIGNLDAC